MLICAFDFALQLVSQLAAARAPGRSVGVFALVDTASLWQYGGPTTNTSAPLLVGQAVQLDAPAPPLTGLPLRQPQAAQPLQLGTRPRGLWNGAVSLQAWASVLAAAFRNKPAGAEMHSLLSRGFAQCGRWPCEGGPWRSAASAIIEVFYQLISVTSVAVGFIECFAN
jgi:hypothetical protein